MNVNRRYENASKRSSILKSSSSPLKRNRPLLNLQSRALVPARSLLWTRRRMANHYLPKEKTSTVTGQHLDEDNMVTDLGL